MIYVLLYILETTIEEPKVLNLKTTMVCRFICMLMRSMLLAYLYASQDNETNILNIREGQGYESKTSQNQEVSVIDVNEAHEEAVEQVQTSDRSETQDASAHQIQAEPILQDSSPTVTFSYTGTVQSYTIPAGVTQILVSAYGAAGGGGTGPFDHRSCGGSPGLGGNVECTVPVTPGNTYYVFVGGSGSSAGGWNGGGAGLNCGRGGGGATG